MIVLIKKKHSKKQSKKLKNWKVCRKNTRKSEDSSGRHTSERKDIWEGTGGGGEMLAKESSAPGLSGLNGLTQRPHLGSKRLMCHRKVSEPGGWRRCYELPEKAKQVTHKGPDWTETAEARRKWCSIFISEGKRFQSGIGSPAGGLQGARAEGRGMSLRGWW